MKIAVHRILFGVASFFMLVSIMQYLLWLNRYEYPIDGQVLFIMLGFFHVALLVLPIFLYRVRIIGLLSLIVLFLTQFLYHIVRFFRYFSETSFSDILNYAVFPMFMLPNFDPNLIRYNPLLASSSYTRFIAAIIAIVATVLSLKASKVSEPLQVHGTPEMRQPQLFAPGANPKKVTGVGTTTESIEQVERLGALLSKGLITKDEFEIKKKEILGL
jgi:hypothetical protein